ncbi:MAG: hypothetical protein JWQ87_3558, partial [Candidatus Sulfotelmatobacter sp.]|nr:hypothetical protein [Candidatus Sulfotelmatobacter sp.]
MRTVAFCIICVAFRIAPLSAAGRVQ